MKRNKSKQTLENKLKYNIGMAALVTSLVAAPATVLAKEPMEIPTDISGYELKFLEKEISKNDDIFEIAEHQPKQWIARLKQGKSKIRIYSELEPSIDGLYSEDKLRVLCADRDSGEELGTQYGPFKLKRQLLPESLTNGSYSCYLSIVRDS